MLKIFNKHIEYLIFLIVILLIFIFNIIHEYFKYSDLVKEELFSGKFQIINVYDKEDFYVVKLKNSDFSFFTSLDKNPQIKKLEYINIALLTTKINFISYLKGFYSKSIYYDLLASSSSLKKSIFEKINEEHKEEKIKQLFNALFLAIPISKEYREIYTNFGVSHLVAISGFHLAIIAGIIYWIFYYPYSFIHQRYFPFRNKKADILVFTILVLFFYLILTDMVPSLLRSFIMFLFAFLFLRSNIKLLSFQTLALTLLVIIALFPKYLFSISMWFSIIGVFYIFLYMQYFKKLSKVVSFLFFNFWIFLVFNPIVHYFFYNTSYEQLISPFITLFFTLFYPVELFLHFIGYSNIFDEYILLFLDYKMHIFEVSTSFLFFILYIAISLASIFDKRAFIFLNILLFSFNIYLYY